MNSRVSLRNIRATRKGFVKRSLNGGIKENELLRVKNSGKMSTRNTARKKSSFLTRIEVVAEVVAMAVEWEEVAEKVVDEVVFVVVMVVVAGEGGDGAQVGVVEDVDAFSHAKKEPK